MSALPTTNAILRRLITTAMAGAMALTFAWQPAAAATGTSLALQLPGDPAIGMMIGTEQALLDLTNTDRAANGLAPLEFDPETLMIARERAATQINIPTLSHYNANGDLAFVDLMASSNIAYSLAGENLARAYDNDPAVTQRIEQALMHSPMHRKNILEQTFNRVSIGVATDGKGQITFAEVYRN